MQAKKDLASRIVADFHSADAAKRAGDDWATQFQKNQVPEQVQVVQVKYSEVGSAGKDGNQARLDKLLLHCGLADSASDGQRKIKQKAVRLQGAVVTDPSFAVPTFPFETLLQVGRQIRRVVITN
jgi:tyrosyl-tRNA synthetase